MTGQRNERAKTIAVCLGFILLTAGLHAQSADLKAVWLAGEAFGRGDLGSIYPPAAEVFLWRPPEAWVTLERARGETGAIYPFLYPPLWAALAAPVAGAVAFPTLAAIAGWVNATLLVATFWLAWRAAGRPLRPSLFIALAMAVTVLTHAGYTALVENQPQILVGFLIVLAAERSRSGAPGQAGAVLALAAAIKLYPVLFALIWLATGRWRALAALGVTGGALAALSVLLAGWPLHALYLEQLGALARSIMLTNSSWSAIALAAQFAPPETWARVPALETMPAPGPGEGWSVIAAGPRFQALVTLLSPAAALVAAGVARTAPSADRLHGAAWPFAIGLVALCGPLSWSYSYIAMLAFAPVLVDRLGPWRGGGILAALALPVSLPAVALLATTTVVPLPLALVGTLAMAGFVALFGVLAMTRR